MPGKRVSNIAQIDVSCAVHFSSSNTGQKGWRNVRLQKRGAQDIRFFEQYGPDVAIFFWGTLRNTKRYL